MFDYTATHASINDGSPAMLVARLGDLIVLVNEDGEAWTDPREDWQEIPETFDVILGGRPDRRPPEPITVDVANLDALWSVEKVAKALGARIVHQKPTEGACGYTTITIQKEA